MIVRKVHAIVNRPLHREEISRAGQFSTPRAAEIHRFGTLFAIGRIDGMMGRAQQQKWLETIVCSARIMLRAVVAVWRL